MHEAETLNLEQMESFLRASEAMRFEGETRQQVYPWMERVLCQQQYHQQGRAARGLVRRYVGKMTGLSRAQVTRLIARYGRCGRIEVAPYRRHRFPQRYTRADVELLALVDEAHENLSGPATRRILQREYQLYGKPEYARLATISVAHLYNLRRQPRYRERRLCYVKTRPSAVPSANGARPMPKAGPVFCASTPCIRATRRAERKACTTSMPSMKSRNGRSWPPRRTLAKPGWNPCWRP